jgi:hypothetical protein
MNTPKRRRRKIELATKKGIFPPLSLVMFHQKEKNIIHINNIKTFSIKNFKNIMSIERELMNYTHIL